MRSIFKAGVALAFAAAMMTASTAPASADYYWHRHHGGAGVAAGVAAGIIGLGILGAAAANERHYYAGEYCHPGPLECHTFERPCFHNDYGDYICPAPERRCFRRPYCE